MIRSQTNRRLSCCASGLGGVFVIGAVLLAGLGPLGADEPKLVYVKKETRQATIEATLQATGLPKITESWYYVGPFDNSDGRGFDTAFEPEKSRSIDLNQSYTGRNGVTLKWREAPQFVDGVVHNLNLFPENEFTCIYLYREIFSETATDLHVSLGSDDSITLWLHGKPVVRRDVERGAAADQDRATLHLRPGKNPILIKICNYAGPCAFYFRPMLPPSLEAELRTKLDRDFPNTATEPDSRHYRIVTLPIPDDIVLEVGGLSFRPDGKLLICTRRGDIYLVSNPTSDDLSKIDYKLFATGLHEPLGMCLVGDDLFVAQRPELTRIRDTDGDDVADQFTTICDRWGVSGDYHEYAFGPARDREGNFFITLNVGFGGGHQSKVPWRGWCVKVSPDGTTTPWASGLRSPNGVNFSPDGDLFFCDNQGEWVAACKLQQIRRGEFYGHPASLRWHDRLNDLTIRSSGQTYESVDEHVPLVAPAVWFPYGKLSQSASEPIWDTTDGAFGPFAGQCFVGDQMKSNVFRVALEQVNGVYQGACFPFRNGFQCGVNRLAFAPDGSLMVGMTNRGWGSVGGSPYGLQRLVYTGVVPFEILTMHLTSTGFELRFTKPVDRETAERSQNYSLQSYTYNYWSTYGSPEVDRQPVPIQSVSVSEDGLSVSLVVAGLKIGRVYELQLGDVKSQASDSLLHREAFYTLNELK